MGTSLYQIAMLYWLLEATGSATTMGLVAMASAIPGVILGPFGGAIADRFSRRQLIVLGDLLLGVVTLSVGLVFFFVEGTVDLKIACLIVAGVSSGIVGTFFRPAVMAAIPGLVPFERLNTANAMNSFSMTTSMAVGQAIGGVLFRVLGAPMLIMINGVTYLLSSLSEVFIRLPQELPASPPSWRALIVTFVGDVREGLRYVWHNRGLRNMVFAFAILNFVTAPLMILMPILLDQHRNLPPDWYGYLMASMAVGNLLGMVFAGAIRIDGNFRFVWAVTSLYAMAGSTLVMGLAESPYSLIAANVVSGFFMGGMMVTFTTLMQATTPDELRGRVSSVMMTVMMGTMPLAMGLAGVLADAVDQNVPLIFVAASGATAFLVSVLAMNRPFRQFLGTKLLEFGRPDNPAMAGESAVER